MRRVDETGKRFTRLTVLRQRYTRGQAICMCRCECGREKAVRASNLRSGHVKSCGCLNAEMSRDRHLRHGRTGTPEYQAWNGARQRCTNPNVERYPAYGGRGIEFRFSSFEEFWAALGPRPSPRHSVDRVDVDGHYEPSNVRWATPAQQARNKRMSSPCTY